MKEPVYTDRIEYLDDKQEFIDEIVMGGANVHLETLDDNCAMLIVENKKHHWHMNIWQKGKSPLRVTMLEDNSPEPIKSEPVCSCGHGADFHGLQCDPSNPCYHRDCTCNKYQPVAPEPAPDTGHPYDQSDLDDSIYTDAQIAQIKRNLQEMADRKAKLEPAPQILDLDIDTNSKCGWNLNTRIKATPPSDPIYITAKDFEPKQARIILPLVEGFAPAFVVLDYIRRQRDADQAILDKALKDNDADWAKAMHLVTLDAIRIQELALKEQAEEIFAWFEAQVPFGCLVKSDVRRRRASYLGGK
jgi:hypothetical protein